ncbi:MAG: thiolase domain-containing protein [Candidatus Atribacteria bacterium]|nr:thiolase domain-containing protein [Candidatus Atribacteria bacterium]
MTDIIIAGIGQTPVGEHWDESLRSLAVQAIQAAIMDSGGLKPQALYVGNMLAASLSRQAHLGALLADYAGLRFDDAQHTAGIEAETVEAGGASGGAALRQGYLAVASGMVDVALVVGVEKFTDVIGPDLEAALATLTDADYESVHGLTLTAQAALLARRYMHENHVPADGLAGFPLTAHANGAGNKNAMYRKAIALDTYQKAEPVSEPLNIFDVAPNADGAAALVLTQRELLPKDFPHPVVRLAASTIASDTLALAERSDSLWFAAAQASAEQAFQKAGITRAQVDLFEYYDAFSIFAALSLEAAGFAKRGQGWKLAGDGSIALTGQLPCATLGGLKARGNPGGATGVYQVVEAAAQLRDQAGANQIAGARYALIQCLGGPASIAVTHILESMA